MAMLKVIEVLAQFGNSWDDAARKAVETAARSVRDIRSIYIKNMEASVEGGRITRYRINANISFSLEES